MIIHLSSMMLEDIEINLLLEGIYRYYGFDFRNYSRVSITRRIWHIAYIEGVKSISALQDKVLHDRECMKRFLLNV